MVRFGGLDCCVAASAEGRAGRSQRDHALSPLQHRGLVASRARAVAGVCGVCDTLPGMDCCVLPLQCQDQIVPDCQDYQTPPYVDSWLQQMQVRVQHATLRILCFYFSRVSLKFSLNTDTMYVRWTKTFKRNCVVQNQPVLLFLAKMSFSLLLNLTNVETKPSKEIRQSKVPVIKNDCSILICKKLVLYVVRKYLIYYLNSRHH